MEIRETSKELTSQDKYFLMKSQGIKKMSEQKGARLDLDMWAIYTDTDKDGKEQELFSCHTPEGETFATNSATFIRSFRDILDCFTPEEIHAINVSSGTSKAGRTFITAIYAG